LSGGKTHPESFVPRSAVIGTKKSVGAFAAKAIAVAPKVRLAFLEAAGSCSNAACANPD
jgi:hypothetical protein